GTCAARMITAAGWRRVGQKARWPRSVATLQQLSQCRAKVTRDREQRDRRVAQKSCDRRLASNHLFLQWHRACRCRPACVRLLCNDAKTHVAPDRSVGRILECIVPGNRRDALLEGRGQLRTSAIVLM